MENKVQFQAVKQSSAPTLLLLIFVLSLLGLCCACVTMFLLLGPHGGVQTCLQQQLVVSEGRGTVVAESEAAAQENPERRSRRPDLSAELQGKHRWQDD